LYFDAIISIASVEAITLMIFASINSFLFTNRRSITLAFRLTGVIALFKDLLIYNPQIESVNSNSDIA